MKKTFGENHSSQRGAVSGWLVGVLLLAAVLVGGVMLLKNVNTKDTNKNNDQVAVQNDSDKTSETTSNETDNSTDEQSGSTSSSSSSTSTTATTQNSSNDSLTATGATSDYTPETLTATGPADTFAGIFGLGMALAGLYMIWNYRQSRRAVNEALLKK